MTHEILDHPKLREELFNRIVQLEIRCATVFGVAPADGMAIHRLTDEYLTQLGHPETAVSAAAKLMEHLVDPAERGTALFWTGALGRALGYWTGGCEQWSENGKDYLGVPPVEAAAILGISRQGVADAVRRGRLVKGDTGPGILALSIADLMKERYPLVGVAA
jgi:hypothetical protein